MASKKKTPEMIYKLGLADPRSGKERAAGLVNRVAQGHKKANRKYDDSPSKIAKARKSKKK